MRKQRFQNVDSKRKYNSKNKSSNSKNYPSENGGSELSYKVQESDVLGRFACNSTGSAEMFNESVIILVKMKKRYLVASRNIPSGEIVMTDEPLVVGPCQEAKPLCIGCYGDIDLGNPRTHRCKNCSWPLCAPNCSGFNEKYGHNREECDVLARSAIKNVEVSGFRDFYYAVTPFRCLVIKTKCPENWNILKTMESHTEERKKLTELWETNEKMVVNVIRNVWGLKEFPEEEIHFVCGILEINAFELNVKNPGTQCLRGVYPKAFLFAHDCVPNTRRSNTQDFQLIVRSTRTIPKNDTISISYAYTLQSTLMRRKHLKSTKFFLCSCKRCSDPTEFGTYTGAMKCSICKTGFLLPENPLNENSLWKCTAHKCSNQTEVSHVIPLLNKLFEELDSIEGNDILGYELFVTKCSSIFHENHYLPLSAMHCLSQLYGKIHGYLINDLTDEQLERKEEICRKLIRIFEKLEPGLSKQKGILLYELQAPLMVLLRRRFQNLPKKEVKSKIKEVLKYLNEAFLILSKEPESSAEGQMAAAAKEAINNLEDWLKFLY